MQDQERDEESTMPLERLEAIINVPPASKELADRRRKATREIQRRGFAIVGGKRTPYRVTRMLGDH